MFPVLRVTTAKSIPCAAVETINSDSKFCGWAKIKAMMDVAYAILNSVNFHRYRNKTPLNRNSSLHASKNMIAFQDNEIMPSFPQVIARLISRVITSA